MFSWCKYSDLINLVTRQVNFGNFKLEETIDPWRKGKCYDIMIDNCIRLLFIHHIRNDKYLEPTLTSLIDIQYKYIYKYVVDKYVARCKRMVLANEPFSFLISYHPPCGSIDEMSELINVLNEYRRNYVVVVPHGGDEFQNVVNNAGNRTVISSVTDKNEWVLRTSEQYYTRFIEMLYPR